MIVVGVLIGLGLVGYLVYLGLRARSDYRAWLKAGKCAAYETWESYALDKGCPCHAKDQETCTSCSMRDECPLNKCKDSVGPLGTSELSERDEELDS